MRFDKHYKGFNGSNLNGSLALDNSDRAFYMYLVLIGDDITVFNVPMNGDYLCTGIRGLMDHEIHYDDVIMGAMASQITSLTVVYSTAYLDVDQRKHQSSTSLAFGRWIPRTNGQKREKCFHLMTSSWCARFFVHNFCVNNIMLSNVCPRSLLTFLFIPTPSR